MANFDSWNSKMYGLPYPIYFYMISSETTGLYDDLTTPLGNCPALLSVQFTPYMKFEDFNTSAYDYDIKRFGEVDKSRPAITEGSPTVLRVNSITEESRVKKLKTTKTYPKVDTQIGKDKGRYWKNESRLFQYPYSFAILSDGISSPLTIKYHLAPKPDMNIKVRNTLSDRCSYGLFVENYKGDGAGQLEAMVSGDIHELPCSSSAYNQWYATSKNSTAQNIQNVSNQSFLSSSQASQMATMQNQHSQSNQQMNQISSGIGAVGSLMNLNLGGVASNSANMMFAGRRGQQERQMNSLNEGFAREQANLNKRSAIQSAMAQIKDLNNTPNTMVSMGSDFIYGYNKQGSSLKLFRYSLTTEYATKLGDYFAMYGYKQNKILNLNDIRNDRYYYNYIKTIGANISSANNMSKNDLDVMKGIFDKGVTIWHVDREGVIVNDYSKDNREYVV